MEGLLVGLTLGLAAGLSPGPLFTLVISTTLQRGFQAGLRLAAVPLITDLPIIILALLVTSAVPKAALDGLAVIGGFVVFWIGIETLREARVWEPPDASALAAANPQDVWRGVIVNLVSPHPWLFWLSIGGPQVVGWWREDAPLSAIGFAGGFFVTLIGAKVALAGLVARGRHRLGGRTHRWILTLCGVALLVLAIILVRDGVLGWLNTRVVTP